MSYRRTKGNNLEYDTQESLKVLHPDIYRTCERGYQLQYDLQTDSGKIVIECKRHAGFSWNQLVSTLQEINAPDGYEKVLVFQANFQPALVMCRDEITGVPMVVTFERYFDTPFLKHESTRKKVLNRRGITNA